MPVTPKVGCGLRHDHEMADTNLDETGATGTRVLLARLVRLDRVHEVVVELTKVSSCLDRGVVVRRSHRREGIAIPRVSEPGTLSQHDGLHLDHRR